MTACKDLIAALIALALLSRPGFADSSRPRPDAAITVSGDGVVWSFSVVHRGPGAFNDEVPYVVVLAKLAEEPRSLIVTGNLIGIDPARVKIGMPIKVVYEDVPEEDITVYRFAPAI